MALTFGRGVSVHCAHEQVRQDRELADRLDKIESWQTG